MGVGCSSIFTVNIVSENNAKFELSKNFEQFDQNSSGIYVGNIIGISRQVLKILKYSDQVKNFKNLSFSGVL